MYESQPLGDEHHLTAFDCGKVDLNAWLSESALHCQRNNTARTFVWCEPGKPTAVAYYSLAGHVVEKQTLPVKLGRGSPQRCPALLLARLALDTSLHGHGLGGVLLADALQQAAHALEHMAARFVVVDALDEEAAAFYSRFGFKRIPDDMRLYQKTSDILRSLGTA